MRLLLFILPLITAITTVGQQPVPPASRQQPATMANNHEPAPNTQQPAFPGEKTTGTKASTAMTT
ncbi:hypothetical protein ACQ86N_21960 [Puia sp. P3]|uniref:hypothetical protein n=1 Tax=Puia sp. P3 TaxID=3423952 RepID=UPI003D66B5AA